jgi:hypothetical protein
MTSKKKSFLVSSKMQKEIQSVASGLALDKLLEEPEMSVSQQDTFIFNTYHGKRNDSNSNSIGLVETIVPGTGIVEDMCFSKEVEIIDPTTTTESTASYLQMNDICTLDPGKAYIVGKLVTYAMLHCSTKTIGASWCIGRSLHAQGREVHKNCKKALGHGRKFLDADGFVKSGNHQPDYFCFVNSCMHKLKHPEQHEVDEQGELIGPGKPDQWMFTGYIYFVLCSPRVERQLDNSKVSACFSTGDESLKGGKGTHGRAAANKKIKLTNSLCDTVLPKSINL